MQARLFEKQNQDIISAALLLAFEAGRWLGQVDCEEFIERSQLSACLAEVITSRKTSMPQDLASTGRTVRYNLRSDVWRRGVEKSSKEYLEKAKKIIVDNLI